VLAKAVPAHRHHHHGHGGHHHHPHHWASDPPRSPLDLLASLPQIDMFTAPHSHQHQHQHQHTHHGNPPASPSITPRTQYWFETTFPNLGSPLPSASSHQHHHQQHHQALPHQPASFSATGKAATALHHLRYPVDAGLGSASYWMPANSSSSGGGSGECESHGLHGHHGRDSLRLCPFGSL
jgi:hypothetical protein